MRWDIVYDSGHQTIVTASSAEGAKAFACAMHPDHAVTKVCVHAEAVSDRVISSFCLKLLLESFFCLNELCLFVGPTC